MIELNKNGNIIETDAEALVNTVNTVGVMGKGVALQFKKAYPDNFKKYEKAAKDNKVQIGKVFVTETGKFTNPKYIINFPTKKHWRYPSKLEWIKEGLIDLQAFILKNNIKSIAIPPLGCGNGKLNWRDVKPLIEKALADIEGLTTYLFEPYETVYSTSSPKTISKRPKLTAVRAMVIALLDRYTILGYELTVLEAQKLVYFLQRFGENLRLEFTKVTYGPYAEKLTHVLADLDGHYLFGMKQKTAKPFDKLEINQKEIEKIYGFIEENCTPVQKERLEMVYKLIEGFESPLGMELLATVDYVIENELKDNYTEPELIKKIYEWSERKKVLLKTNFITTAHQRLIEFPDNLYNHHEQ